jgi:hypothetical protein
MPNRAPLRQPRCRFCGEPSIYPWGAQQVCARCERIIEDFETDERGYPIRRIDTEILLHVQRCLRDQDRWGRQSQELPRATGSAKTEGRPTKFGRGYQPRQNFVITAKGLRPQEQV